MHFLRCSTSIRLILLFTFLSTVLFIFGCSKSVEDDEDNVFDVGYSGDKDLISESLTLEKVYLSIDPSDSSFEGFTQIVKESIIFVDHETSQMFIFDTEGNLVERALGRGEGPRELPGYEPMFYHTTPDGRHVFIGGINDIYIFDADLNRIKTLQIGWQGTPPEAMDGSIDPENDRAYNIAYHLTNIRASNQFIYMPIIGAPPLFLDDFNLASDAYAKEARILARIDMETGNITELIGRLSPIFLEQDNVRFFSYPVFDLDSGDDMVISFFPDSLMYRAYEGFNITESFGYAGRNMNTAYQEMPDASEPSQYRQYFMTERQERGFYTSLSVVEEEDLIFRGYTRGRNADSDGLQIYRNDTLIADVDVPQHPSPNPFEGFEVAGYVAPYFYSTVFTDEDYETMWVYRFRIDGVS